MRRRGPTAGRLLGDNFATSIVVPIYYLSLTTVIIFILQSSLLSHTTLGYIHFEVQNCIGNHFYVHVQ